MTSYELTHFKKMVRVWKTKSLLFCLRYDPLIVFRRQNHITFIFIKTMSHDLLVQVAYSATVIALPEYHPRGVLFWLTVYFFFSEIKTQNFRDDSLLVQKINSFIFYLMSDFSKYISLTDYFSFPHPTPQFRPLHCNFSPGFWWSQWWPQ